MDLRNSRAVLAVAFLIASICASTAFADAWTQREGDYLIKLSFSRIDTRTEFDVNGRRAALFSEYSGVQDGEFSTTDLTFYGEYGFTDAFTVLVMGQFRQATASHVDSFLVTRPNSGLGDVYIAGRVRIPELPFASSIQVGAKIPAADTGSVTTVALGSGSMDFDALLNVGTEQDVGRTTLRVQGDWGFRFRGGNYDDAILYGADLSAIFPGGKLSAHGGVNGSITQGKIFIPDPTSAISPGFALTGNQTSMQAFIGAAFHSSKRLQFFFDWTTVLDGRSTLGGNLIALGVAFTPGQPTPLAPKP